MSWCVHIAQKMNLSRSKIEWHLVHINESKTSYTHSPRCKELIKSGSQVGKSMKNLQHPKNVSAFCIYVRAPDGMAPIDSGDLTPTLRRHGVDTKISKRVTMGNNDVPTAWAMRPLCFHHRLLAPKQTPLQRLATAWFSKLCCAEAIDRANVQQEHLDGD